MAEANAKVLNAMQQFREEDAKAMVEGKTSTMDERMVLELKGFYSAQPLTEPRIPGLARFFTPEIKELDLICDEAQALADALAKLFELFLASFMFKTGKYQFKELKECIEKRVTTLTVLREHGFLQE